MHILVNKKLKQLFRRVLLLIAAFAIISAALIGLKAEHAAIYIFAAALVMGILILAAGYWYFREQSKIMEHAVRQIKEYIYENKNTRIECDDEGELYRVFHEVNAMAAILNAQAENEEKAKKFLESTISDISHQLKTPLAALNIYNGIIQEEAGELPTIREFAALSEQELDRIETLVQSLLKIAKLDAGAIAIEKAAENASEMMSDIEKQFRYRTEQEEKTIVLSGGNDVTLLCDRNWLSEALGNIVKNAIDHTEAGDTVWIEWKQFGSIIQMIIRDNGSGIHPEDLYHIFKRFYRSRFSKDSQGIGLGLSFAKAVIEAHHGTIKADSESGVGTTFTIDFLIPTKL